MIIHWLQHVPFEGLGAIEPWASEQGHQLERIALHAGDPLPDGEQVEALIVMGGPMSVHDRELYPWLIEEERLIGQVLAAQRPCLGICLGAQLMAHAGGAAVTVGAEREIGWIPIDPTPAMTSILGMETDSACVFHWHGERFDLPPGAERLASSAVCPNQIVRIGPRAVAMQCHLETTPASLAALCQACPDDHQHSGGWVQTAASMQAVAERRCAAMAPLLDRLLQYCFGTAA